MHVPEIWRPISVERSFESCKAVWLGAKDCRGCICSMIAELSRRDIVYQPSNQTESPCLGLLTILLLKGVLALFLIV